MKYVLIGLGMLSVSACSTMPFEEPIHTHLVVPFASNSDTQYLDSKNAPDLVVTPPLSKANLSGFYRLPPPPKDSKVNIEPPVT